jgi:hypothetical protein
VLKRIWRRWRKFSRFNDALCQERTRFGGYLACVRNEKYVVSFVEISRWKRKLRSPGGRSKANIKMDLTGIGNERMN